MSGVTAATGGTDGFREARRELSGLTTRVEKRLLLWLAARTPAAIGPDRLTALGLIAAGLCGALYAGSGRQPWLLLLVNVGLALNWLGDSLDGTLARYRRRERPRYGFYLDHLVDAFGALLILAGLGLSGLMSPWLAVAVLVAYYLLSMEIFLATYTRGRFRISYAAVGGTELRMLLAALNLAAFLRPEVSVLGQRMLLFDVAGYATAAGLLAILAHCFLTNRRALLREDEARLAARPSE